ncbi:hypothetical protein K6025_02850 [Ehrlichia sp. JZT12]
MTKSNALVALVVLTFVALGVAILLSKLLHYPVDKVINILLMTIILFSILFISLVLYCPAISKVMKFLNDNASIAMARKKVFYLFISCPVGENIMDIDPKEGILSLVYVRESEYYIITQGFIEENSIKIKGSEIKPIFDYDTTKIEGPGFIIPVKVSRDEISTFESFLKNNKPHTFYKDPRIVKDILYLSCCYRTYPKDIKSLPLLLEKMIHPWKGAISKNTSNQIAVYEILLYQLFKSCSIDELSFQESRKKMENWLDKSDGKLAICLINYFRNDVVYKGCISNEEVHSLNKKIGLLKSCTAGRFEMPTQRTCDILYEKIHDILCSMDPEFFPYYDIYKCESYELKNGVSTLSELMLKDLMSVSEKYTFRCIFAIASYSYSSNFYYDSNCFIRELLVSVQEEGDLNLVDEITEVLDNSVNQELKFHRNTYLCEKFEVLAPLMKKLGIDDTQSYNADELIALARQFIVKRYGRSIKLYYDHQEEIKRPIDKLVLIPNVKEKLKQVTYVKSWLPASCIDSGVGE